MTELELLKRKLEREKAARKQAENILEAKALELFSANESLRKLNESLEDQIQERTKNLQESEAKYRNVVDNATDIIYTTDEEGYFTFINPRGTNAFGYSLEEIIGKRYIDFILDEYKEKTFEHYSKFKEKGTTTGYFEFPIRSQDNTVHWIGQNVERVQTADGNFYYNAVARDITLRKNAEDELAKTQKVLTQSEVKYRSVLENLELGLMEVDIEGKIIRAYDHFCKMTGYTKEELIGKDAISTLLVEDYTDVVRKQDESRLDNNTGVYEVQIARKDGKHIWVLISGAPFYNSEGEVIGSLGIHYDITDRKELEKNLTTARQKAIEAQKAEQQFLAHMSHEIRTPLNAIIGMSHILKDTSLDDKQTELLEILSDSASLLKGLVSDILDISKIDSGMIEKNETTFDLSILATRLIKTFELRAHDKGLKLTSEIDCPTTSIVTSDKQWINQILINLISNGIKFTAEGEVTLTIKTTKISKITSQFYFEVKDTGIGIKASELDSVFNSFKQANKNIRTDYGGTGLGLSIATRLVDLLGGELEVESTEGKGSRFFFSVNMVTAPNHTFTNDDTAILNQQIDKNKKLLVVEDNIMNQKYISTLLEKWNLSFDIAENGQHAVDKYKQQHYDLIFMDLSMPVMDGYEATNIIRNLADDAVPIIALTASTFLSKKELALESGMTDFLAKPFTPDELSEMLQKHLVAKPKANKQKQLQEISYSIDRATIDALYKGDTAYALEMFQTYDSIIDVELATLKNTVGSKTPTAIKKQIHKIKPMFKMVGLTTIFNACESLESTIVNSPNDNIKTGVTQLIHDIKSTRSLITDEIERLGNTRQKI